MAFAPIFPTPPKPHAPNPRLTVHVEGSEISERFGVQWQDVLSQIGTGEFQLLNSHTAIATIEEDQLVIFKLDGTEFLAWVIDAVTKTTLAEGEEGDEVTVFAGKTTLSELTRGVTLPASGVRFVDTPIFTGYVTTKPYSPERFFGPMEPSYDDSSWDAAVEVAAPVGSLAPANWPDPDAFWIGTDDDVLHHRETFTTSGVFTVKIFFAAANAVHLFVDGVLVSKVDDTIDGDAASKTRSVKVEVTDGTHTIYARVARGAKPDSLLILSVFEVGTDNVLCRTTSSWKSSPTVEKVTVGSVAIQAFTEAQGRDTVTEWDWDFTELVDTAGRPWPDMGDWYNAPVKDKLLDLLNQLVEGWAEMAALAANGGRTLSMWVAEGVLDGNGDVAPGRPLDLEFEIEVGVNATKLVHGKQAVSGNVGAIEFNDGLIMAQLDDSVTAHGRREVGLALGSLDGPMALYVAEAQLRPTSTPELTIVAEFEPVAGSESQQLSIVTGLGGTLTAPNWTGTPTSYRVKAHSGGEDDDGNLIIRPELNTATDVLDKRYQQFMARTNNGTNNGRSLSATVTSKQVTGAQVVTPLGGLDFSTGGAYSIVGDRGSARRPSEPALVVRFDAVDDTAGASGDTTYQVEVDASPIGTVTLPDTVDEGTTTLAAPVYVDQENLLNIEATAAGGHVGVSVKVIAVPIG
jgi:hypothetical protein